MWRSVARNRTPGIALQKKVFYTTEPSDALIGKQQAFFDEERDFIEIPYYDGEKLSNGMIVQGPAIVVLPDTTIIVLEKIKLSTQPHGYYILER
jgi:N-methylhydantoinase A/oxoprolinase/acetone carboxylase beta subunit